jgi:tetratricopeptide (TPR) repeat protein
MKNKLVIVLFLVIGTQAFAQKSAEYKRQQYIFEKATTFNDPVVARNALYNMMALEPNNLDLLDSLAVFYYNYNIHTSAVIAAKEALVLNPSNELAMEVAAISFENLRMKDRALEEYENLYLKSDNIFTLYKMAILQYDLERFEETNTTTDILLKRKEVESEKVVFTKEDNSEFEISIKAAIFNLKGMAQKKINKVEEAKISFTKAVEIAPEFELAKENLSNIYKQ